MYKELPFSHRRSVIALLELSKSPVVELDSTGFGLHRLSRFVVQVRLTVDTTTASACPVRAISGDRVACEGDQ
jgi:hypothetical protein